MPIPIEPEGRHEGGRAQRSRDLAALAPYLRAIRSAPLLTRDEERALARRARAGDVAAREVLVRRNLALVVAVVRTQRWGGLLLEDVIQEGNLGLIRAATSFDPDAGTRFSTYAVWWIRAYVGKYLKEARSSVRPRSGVVAQPDTSLDVPVGEDLLVDRVADERIGPEEAVAAAELQRIVREAIEHVRRRLRGLGRDIVQRRFRRIRPPRCSTSGGAGGCRGSGSARWRSRRSAW
jgi:RNA polymerase primary sigma factor